MHCLGQSDRGTSLSASTCKWFKPFKKFKQFKTLKAMSQTQQGVE